MMTLTVANAAVIKTPLQQTTITQKLIRQHPQSELLSSKLTIRHNKLITAPTTIRSNVILPLSHQFYYSRNIIDDAEDGVNNGIDKASEKTGLSRTVIIIIGIAAVVVVLLILGCLCCCCCF